LFYGRFTDKFPRAVVFFVRTAIAMKSPILFLTAVVLGFAGGWLAKPTPQSPPAPPPASPAKPVSAPASPAPAEPSAAPQSLAPGGAPVERVPQPPLPAVAAAANPDEAKLARLAELLGLDEEGEDALKLALDEARAAYTAEAGKALTSRESLDHIAKVAGQLERAIVALLKTPEQQAAFAALRQRERDNRIETRSQREMSVLTGITDILPEQREGILAHLRERAAAEAAKLPPELAFAVESSAVPLGPLGLTEEALLAMLHAADDDPALAKADVFTRQARRLDEQLAYLKTVLTPAQFAQVEQAAAAQRAIHERIRSGGGR
jgi:hypothetical protein